VSETIRVPGLGPLLVTRLCSSLARHMRLLVLSWLVFELTKSPLALGLIGLAEAIPYIVSVLWAGQFVDRTEKRSVLLRATGGMALSSAGLTALIAGPSIPLWAVYGFICLLGLFTSYMTVGSSAYLQSVVAKEHYPRVFAWNVGLFQTGIIAGPILAGSLIAWQGAFMTMAAVLLLECFSVASVFCYPLHHPSGEHHPSAIQSIATGLRFIRSKKILLAPMALDMVAVLFGDVVAILPVFADMLGVGPEGLGVLRAAPALGSIVVTIVQGIRPWVPISWKILLRVAELFGISMIFFALSGHFWLSVLLLILGGVVDGMSVIIRQSMYQSNTPDEYRGRVAAVNGIFVRTSNEIGAFESGLAASLLGTVPSVIFGGAVAVGVAALMRWRFPTLD
jgi:MFS family permease